jgi:RNA binding exosome subunit
MIAAHSITVEIFVQPGEKIDKIKQKFLSLFPFDLNEEKIDIYEKSVIGFNNKIIKVLRIDLLKKRHIKAFLDNLFNQLSEETKNKIKDQAKKRLDQNLNFYLRFDKYTLLNRDLYKLTDQGDCFYIKFKIAAFPKNESNALNIIYDLLK